MQRSPIISWGLAQLLAAQKENPFKGKVYREAKSIRSLSESLDDADLTERSTHRWVAIS